MTDAPKFPEPRPGQQQYHDDLLQFFKPTNTDPAMLKATNELSVPFEQMAEWLMRELPANPERTVCLRHLLDAKHAAVRARLYKR